MNPALPSIVLILTDDQRWDTLDVMPNVRSKLIAKGVTFTNSFVVNPLCCPSRASILTGRYSHGTGVYADGGPLGIKAFDDTSTVATWLRDVGYRTALVGKYLNHYRGRRIPPGWDRWTAFVGPISYYGYTLDENGDLADRGHKNADYSTDVLASTAVRFIRTTPSTQPLFLYFAPFAPHSPATPPRRYAERFARIGPFRPPNYDEADVADKPAWLRAIPRFTSLEQVHIDALRRRQLQSLLAVDDAVKSILTALRSAGRLGDTMILLTSDNGVAWGEHRWRNKIVPYEESIRVPLVVRYDALMEPSGTDDSLVANIDIAPTFAQLAGTSAPGAEGKSLLALLDGRTHALRRVLLIEHAYHTRAGGRRPGVPAYCGVRSTTWKYVRYATGEEELYALRRDPYESRNLAGEARWGIRLRAMRSWTRRLCRPLPPGMPAF